jgi:IclR family mhp operon transcriptional activator
VSNLVQSVRRCLGILEFLNIRGSATLQEVCQATGLTRGTAYRMLETLRYDRFIRKEEGSPRYWPSERLHCLSDGYQQEWWIEKIAKPVVDALGREIRWPVKLLTPDDHQMLTRVTTDFSSPFTDGKYPSGFRVSIPWSAAGRAYLAFCDADARAVLMDRIKSAAVEGEAKPFPANFESILKQVKINGYSLVDQKPTSFYSLSVPVLDGDFALGSLVAFFFRSAVVHDDAITRFGQMLKQAAATIGTEFSGAGARN